MNLALWIVQGLLCAFFVMAGGMKVFAYERFKKIGRIQIAESKPRLFERARDFHWDQ